MIFSVDTESEQLEHLPAKEFSRLDVLEREDLQEWAIEEPRILGEDLLVITSEYANFEDTRDRLDILALDSLGKLVVVELKRDRADRTTDLQAIKYASYCATLTAEEIQQDYREFWSDRIDDELSEEDVGQHFVDFLAESVTDEVPLTDTGWANFELDDKPRILLAAGSFGTEITSPVMWLIEEYGMDITCTRIEGYEHRGRILLNSQQVIPVAEAEEYMTKRREKQEKQESSSRRKWALPVLLDRGVLLPDDQLIFAEDQVPADANREWNLDDDYWQARVTGKTGQQDNVEWLHDGETYSFTGLSKEMLHDLMGRDRDKALNGYEYWTHPEFDYRTLSDLRNNKVTAPERNERSGTTVA
jgi:hypothetical protein